ncbi:LytTR family DNA-binding domain-containing protein [Alteromonas sp. KUL49]|uniref:LytTR family DNA-binding domain-containing protein n=1 Tax=Alteromonas sp. KUL49 TaxID=2480798 RepID=UPI00102EDA82|nr:LytTR family DNA-binding domain-containing protein [Alteromonas sp. KUL49]TAP42315.1 LytTR family transcriptional regulator [Alteromonas sp. KUL49]GEA09922.1 hypothetical protein KUL49_02970 [Alteromonas sp. KUL49]
MSSSQKRVKRSLSIWQFALLLTLAYGLGLVISHQTTVFEKIYWSGYSLEQLNEQGEWVDGNRFNIGDTVSSHDVRFLVTIDQSEKWQRPVGLFIGGPFSADIYWDGEKIGDKGAAGDTREQEEIGLIDVSVFIPIRMLTPGQHEIRLRISTHHLIQPDDSVFHYIWLGPYREGGRRDIRYYFAPLFVLSALIVLSFQSFRIGHNAGNPMHIGLGLFGFSIVVMLMAEVSRAIVNYPYHYHELRGIFGWVSNIAAGIALIYTSAKVTTGRLRKFILITGILIVVASHVLPMSSGDMRLAMDFVLFVLGPAAVFLVLAFRKQVNYFSTLPLFFFACALSCYWSVGLFLDSFIFIAALILIGGAWVWVYVEVKADGPEITRPEETKHFVIRTASGETSISVDQCFALKGEGNYTAVLLANGESLLHQDGLGAIMDSQPIGFVRVHKSYAVNLGAVVKLKSATGSKYWLEMQNGETIPVSRYRVAELRGQLE